MKILSINGGQISLFGASGYVKSDEFGREDWQIMVTPGNGYTSIEPIPVKKEMENMLSNLKTNTKQLVISPIVAIRLFLEGALTKRQVKAAKVNNDKVFFSCVELGSQKFQLIVDPETEQNYQAV